MYISFVLDKPQILQFEGDETNVCQNDVVTFTCSADGNPVVHTYQLYENDTLVGSNSSGVWSRAMSAGGQFIYKCVANNTLGTASSMSVSITVNGKQKLMLHLLNSTWRSVTKRRAISVTSSSKAFYHECDKIHCS